MCHWPGNERDLSVTRSQDRARQFPGLRTRAFSWAPVGSGQCNEGQTPHEAHYSEFPQSLHFLGHGVYLYVCFYPFLLLFGPVDSAELVSPIPTAPQHFSNQLLVPFLVVPASFWFEAKRTQNTFDWRTTSKGTTQ